MSQVVAEPVAADQIVGAVGEVEGRSPWQIFWSRFKKDKVAIGGGLFIILLVLIAVFAPLIIKIVGVPGPNVQNANALDQFGTPTGPSSAHPFGVDTLGRDVFARVLYGARVTMLVGLSSVLIGDSIGFLWGLLSGYGGRRVDLIRMALLRSRWRSAFGGPANEQGSGAPPK